MKGRVFLIHGWGGGPSGVWFPWLKEDLEEEGFRVIAPSMPDSAHPVVEDWINKLGSVVGEPDERDFFVGHSLGCQAILRYLQSLPEGERVGGAVLVAGFVNLKDLSSVESRIAEPWLENSLNWNKIRCHCDDFVAIFSDNDPWVPVSDSQIFEDKLGAKIIIKKGQGHFGLKRLPVVMHELLRIS